MVTAILFFFLFRYFVRLLDHRLSVGTSGEDLMVSCVHYSFVIQSSKVIDGGCSLSILHL